MSGGVFAVKGEKNCRSLHDVGSDDQKQQSQCKGVDYFL